MRVLVETAVETGADPACRVDSPPAAAKRCLCRRIVRPWLLAPLAALLIWRGSVREQCPPDDGTALEGTVSSSVAADGRLRIGTFNIHGGKGRDRLRDLRRTAECLRTLDVVGLNEVHGAWFWQQSDQAAVLGHELGLQWLFAPTEERWWHYRFGNGMLSSLPVTSWQQIPLARRHGRSFRNLLLANVQYGGRTIRVVVAHIDRSSDEERRTQLRVAGDLFMSLAAPAVLLGDMNTPGEEPEIRRLLDAPGVRDPLADVLGDKAPRRIDWIFTRGLRTLDAGIVEIGASDHPHIWAELELEKRG
ncbi:MAG: endonuclease/exonuclease/phosphatase family protein [Pirellulales bacterium]